jgi:hypothetical protein
MARFIVIHQTPAGGTQEELIKAAKRLMASLAPGAEWLNSWWMPGEVGKLFCEWEAPDEDTIRTSTESVQELFPIESIHLVTWVDPQWYK